MPYRLTPLEPFGLLIEAEGPGQLANSCDIEQLRALFREEQLLVLRGFSPFASAEQLVEFCERWGEVSVWPFGKVLELKEQKHPEDHIFDHNYVPLHWDGMYRLQVPEYQIFHCVEAPRSGQGGRTTFSHTTRALKHAAASERALWEKVTGRYQRKMEFYDSLTVSPLITVHPTRPFPVIRYNEPPAEEGNFLNPPILKFTGGSEDEIREFHRTLQAALYGSQAFYAHEWKSGDLVIADNYTLLHGREGFETASPRHLRRVHVLGNPPLQNPALVSHQ